MCHKDYQSWSHQITCCEFWRLCIAFQTQRPCYCNSYLHFIVSEALASASAHSEMLCNQTSFINWCAVSLPMYLYEKMTEMCNKKRPFLLIEQCSLWCDFLNAHVLCMVFVIVLPCSKSTQEYLCSTSECEVDTLSHCNGLQFWFLEVFPDICLFLMAQQLLHIMQFSSDWSWTQH